MKAGPYGTGSAIRDAVDGCDSALGGVAANPGSGQAISAGILSPAALFVLLFAIVLAGAVFLAALYALFQALKTILTLVTALLPGEARGTLWMTIGELVMSLVTLVFCIVFLAGYLQLIGSVFTGSKPGDGVMATFFFVDILLLAGIVLFWRYRKRLRRAAERLAKVLATRPGAGPSALPQRRQFDPAATYYKARLAARTGRSVSDAAGHVGGGLAGGRDKLWDATGGTWALGKAHDRAAAGGTRVRAGSEQLRAGLAAAARGLPATAGGPLLMAGAKAAVAATTALSAGGSGKAFGAKAGVAATAVHTRKVTGAASTAAARRAALLDKLTRPAPAGPGRPTSRSDIPPLPQHGSGPPGPRPKPRPGHRTPQASDPVANPAAGRRPGSAPPTGRGARRPATAAGKVVVIHPKSPPGAGAPASSAAAAPAPPPAGPKRATQVESLRAALDARRRWTGLPPAG